MTWLKFEPCGCSKSRITLMWSVVAASGGIPLGMIKWFGRWRKYCFFPTAGTVFEEDCLRDIAQFCINQTEIHRLRLKRRKRDHGDISVLQSDDTILLQCHNAK